MIESCDVIVIGGGIAGVSSGHDLAADRSGCLVEGERSLARPTTGLDAQLLKRDGHMQHTDTSNLVSQAEQSRRRLLTQLAHVRPSRVKQPNRTRSL